MLGECESFKHDFMTYLNMWRLMKEKSRRNAYFLCLGRKRHIDQLCTAAVYSDNSPMSIVCRL